MSDYSLDGVFDPNDIEEAKKKPSLGDPRSLIEAAINALNTTMQTAKTPGDKRQAANALLKFLQQQGVSWEGEGGDEPWVPPPEYNAKLVYHLNLLWGKGGLHEPGSRRTDHSHAATLASALGHKGGPVFRQGVDEEGTAHYADQHGNEVRREEGEVNIEVAGRFVPRHWHGGEVVQEWPVEGEGEGEG